MTRPMISGPYRTFRRLNEYESFLEFEGSTITIPMKGRRTITDPWMTDEVKLKAFMRLEVYPAYVNNLGTREFQFTIRDWDLYGTCPMLNELFFGNPRGRWTEDSRTGRWDYVPVQVTFNVSQNHHVVVGTNGVSADALFGKLRAFSIRNLTSHHLRRWYKPWDFGAAREGGDSRREILKYSLPQSRIYWQIVGPDEYAQAAKRNEVLRSLAKIDGNPMMLFHLQSSEPGTPSELDLSDPEEVADGLIAVQGLVAEEKAPGILAFTAKLPDSGFRANRVQLEGNAVLSFNSRPRTPVEIRGAVDLAQVRSALKQGKLWGFIQLVSPARSLGTADQGPGLGEPIDSADFPARLTYAINYDICLNRERFVEDQAGVAIADGALEVPPRDVTVAFDKPHIGSVINMALLEFHAGHCTGMHEITEADYHRGVNFCRYWRGSPDWRGVPLKDEVPLWPDFVDYDPAINY